MGGSTAWWRRQRRRCSESTGAGCTPDPPAAADTDQEQPGGLMQMSDQDALDTVKAIAAQPIATDGSQNDTFCQRWLNATGLANEMPEVLDDVAFGKARRKAGANKLYHSDKSTDGTSASAVKTLKQLQTGSTAYASFGTHGSGTYLDTSAVSNASTMQEQMVLRSSCS